MIILVQILRIAWTMPLRIRLRSRHNYTLRALLQAVSTCGPHVWMAHHRLAYLHLSDPNACMIMIEGMSSASADALQHRNITFAGQARVKLSG